MSDNFYNILDIPLDATPEEIRMAYFTAAKKYHPDVNPEDDTSEAFRTIQRAYETLASTKNRLNYDESLSDTEKRNASIAVNIIVSRGALPRMAEPQLVYVLLEMECTKSWDPDSLPPVEVCLVIDRSTSMRGERMDMVRSNVRRLLMRLRPKDRIGIVHFSDRAEVLFPMTEIKDPAKYEPLLYNLQASGATEIFQGLNQGVELLKNDSHFLDYKNLILITDGHTYGDEIKCLELASESHNLGISINALGIGHEWNDAFLDLLASKGGGNAVFVQSSEQLSQFLEKKISSINMNYARKMDLRYETIAQAKLEYAFRIHPDLTPLPLPSPIPFGSLDYGTKTSVILEFKLSPILDEMSFIELFRGKLNFKIPSLPTQNVRTFLNLKVPISESSHDDNKPPSVILNAMSRLTLYRLQERVRAEVEAGDFPKATQHLHHLATHLIDNGNHDLANLVLREAEYVTKFHKFSQDGDKKIKYGTRGLLFLPSPEKR